MGNDFADQPDGAAGCGTQKGHDIAPEFGQDYRARLPQVFQAVFKHWNPALPGKYLAQIAGADAG